jgi:hypothetical protein
MRFQNGGFVIFEEKDMKSIGDSAGAEEAAETVQE